ncbi:MAG: hypothetical protein ACI9WC_001952 [Arenicella sp.]|jgi:hypothetical protein
MDLTTLTSLATTIGVLIGACAVLIGAWEIRQSKKLSEAQFEDSFDQQYRELSHEIPVDALLGKSLDEGKKNQAREAIYNYLDLCNEQVYQRVKKRVSQARWHEWSSGIKANLNRPFFNEIWEEVKIESKGSFSFLERLEQEDFKSDPAKW